DLRLSDGREPVRPVRRAVEPRARDGGPIATPHRDELVVGRREVHRVAREAREHDDLIPETQARKIQHAFKEAVHGTVIAARRDLVEVRHRIRVARADPEHQAGHDHQRIFFHGQSPRSTPKKTLRAGGYGVTSCPRPTASVPKFETSGSSPVYGKLQKRLRPDTSIRIVRTRPRPTVLTQLSGTSKLKRTSRSLTNRADSTHGVPPAAAEAKRLADAAESASRKSGLS